MAKHLGQRVRAALNAAIVREPSSAVRDLADAAVVNIERAFERAAIWSRGRPLSADAKDERFSHDSLRNQRELESGDAWAGGRVPRGYVMRAWLAKQFYRGATGQRPVGVLGGFTIPTNEDDFPTPESRLGLELWKIGRRLADGSGLVAWSDRKPTDRDIGTIAKEVAAVIEAVRTRLHWPRLPSDYDPPPPSQWRDDPTAGVLERGGAYHGSANGSAKGSAMTLRDPGRDGGDYQLGGEGPMILREPPSCSARGPFWWADISLCLRREKPLGKAPPILNEGALVAEFVAKALPELHQETKEHVLVIPVDTQLRSLGIAHLSTGTMNASLVHPREVVQIVTAVPAAGFFLVHNHPSGEPALSAEDKAVAERMTRVAEVMGLRFLDMLAVAPQRDGSWKWAGTQSGEGTIAARRLKGQGELFVREPGFGPAWRTRAPFSRDGGRTWFWVTWDTPGSHPQAGNKHALILEKAKDLGANRWDFGQADHDTVDRMSRFAVTPLVREKLPRGYARCSVCQKTGPKAKLRAHEKACKSGACPHAGSRDDGSATGERRSLFGPLTKAEKDIARRIAQEREKRKKKRRGE